MEPKNSYLIITPAYNEEEFIEQTIQSVLSQTILPKRWVIVDDSSTDSTPIIIKKYAEEYRFIQYYLRQKSENQDYYASNVYAIMEGYESIKDQEFNFLAILDADILLPEYYYDKIITEFLKDDALGVASGIYKNLINGKLQNVLNDRRSTPKALQVFRKNIFEKIGGYLPLPYGGEDTISCVMIRMIGKKAWSFPDIIATHLRPTGTGANSSLLKARFRQGYAEYHLASHPLFFSIKIFRRMLLEKPFLLSGLYRGLGYLQGKIHNKKRMINEDVVNFIRHEQLLRIFPKINLSR